MPIVRSEGIRLDVIQTSKQFAVMAAVAAVVQGPGR